MKRNRKYLNVFCISGLLSILIFVGLTYSEDYDNDVTNLLLTHITQVFPPAADGGEDIATYIHDKTLFRGYGSSKDDYLEKYEWDFDGDGEYDWESTESGISYHKYKIPGNYKALFKVTDSQGNFSVDSVTVFVSEERIRGKQNNSQEYLTSSLDVNQSAAVSGESQAMASGDGVTNRYAVMINGAYESRFWDDVTFMYSTLIDDYQFTPQSIYLLNHDGFDPSGANPDNMIDYPASRIFIDDVFSELGNIVDSDDELFVWITGHGRGYYGSGSTYYGYMDGQASIDTGDEEDYLEGNFKLRSFYVAGNYSSNVGMDVWHVYKKYYSAGNYRMMRHKYMSHFNSIYFEELGIARSDNDVFIEGFTDYLAGDYNRNGIVETNAGEVYDYDNDGVPPHDPVTDSYDEDDWGFIDHYDDDITSINTQVPGNNYIVFDANLDNHVDIDINYDINNLEIDGTDIDNLGLFDGLDVNDDGDMDDWISIDEIIQIYGDTLSDDELAIHLNEINAGATSIVAQPCFSGGLVEDLSNPDRIISTASAEEALSYGNLFIRNFTSAFHRADFSGAPVDADFDGNGLISMQEAFNYASANDYYSETPQYDDNGDGISHPYPIPDGGDGNLGATVYLAAIDDPALNSDAGPDTTISPDDIDTTIIEGYITGGEETGVLFCVWATPGGTYMSEIMDVGTNGECHLDLSASPITEPGIYTLFLVGNNGSEAALDSMILTIDDPALNSDAGPDTTISLDDIGTTIIEGYISGGDETGVLFCVWATPEGKYMSGIIDVGTNGECHLDLSASPITEPGVYTLFLVGNNGSEAALDSMILTVTDPGPPES